MSEKLHENIRSSDPRTRSAHLYSAPAQPAAEDEVAHFLAALVRLIKPAYVLEFGTAFGHTAAVIGAALAEHGGHLDTLEIRKERHKEATKRLAGLPATPHLASYREWAPPEGRKYDMAFFDADRANRDAEYEIAKPWLSRGAVLAFHDAGLQHGVAQEAFARLTIPTLYLPCPRGLLLAARPWA